MSGRVAEAYVTSEDTSNLGTSLSEESINKEYLKNCPHPTIRMGVW
jgi:hypothetical protein